MTNRYMLISKLRILPCFILLLLFPVLSKANHIFGADFFYEHLSGNTYRISLIVYGDCKSSNFNSLQNATPTVNVYDGTQLTGSLRLSQQGAGVEVTPVCEAEKNNTTCHDVSSAIPGVTRYIYTGTYTLSGISANWKFRFDGMLATSQAGRSNQITNIVNPGSSVIALEAKLNNIAGSNSSPTFTTIPTPFYCINVPQQYNLGASDPDGDGLSFALSAGLTSQSVPGSTGGPVSYIAPYTAQAPLAAASGTFSFSTTTGQMNFTPSSIQTSLVVQEVEERRNGVVVGTSSREMTFIVITNCNTTPASNAIDTAASGGIGGVRNGANTFTVCKGADSVAFNIRAINPGNNIIKASYTGLPAGATVTISGDSTTSPVLNFKWNRITAAAGSYSFYVTFHDDGCPLSSVQTSAYTINVVNPNTASEKPLSVTNCYHRAAVQLNFEQGLLPRNVEISSGGKIVRSFVDNTGTYTDSLEAGIYQVHVTSPGLTCATDMSFTVSNSGVYPVGPQVPDVFYCRQEKAIALTASPDSGAVVHWYTSSGNPLGSAPTPQTDVPGLFIWYVSQKRDVCESLFDTVRVYVTERPVANFSLTPKPLCINDTAILKFTGTIGAGPAVSYSWSFDGGIADPDTGAGPFRVNWLTKGTKYVTLQVTENRCSSSVYNDSIQVKTVPFASIEAPDKICKNQAATISYNGRETPGLNYEWTFSGNPAGLHAGAGPFAMVWQDSGAQVITLRVEQDGCEDIRTRAIYVNPLPEASILNIPEQVCIGQTLHLQAAWQPFNGYIWSRSSAQYPVRGDTGFVVQLIQPERFRLEVTSSEGCVDSTSQTWTEVQPCCNFSYPNAFTPNNDGRNDQFKVVAYGNQLRFQMSIYNRWGQRVFYGSSVAEGWDGTFGGKQCEPGSYYYVVDAKCFTGYEEHHKGDLILVR
jgi:gliding motility-associated-like protein